MFELITPVVFCTFNRYDVTMRVFSRIREIQPKRLYLVSDAPRESKEGEAEVVSRIRNEIENSVDWDCDLIKIYADHNMGCAKRISSALDYVFEREECAIILEDDCFPALSFFEFCQTILKQYHNDDRILSVCGSTSINYTPKQDVDYYFSGIFGCWGWATWKRAWKCFDFEMKDYSTNSSNPNFKRFLFNRNAYWNNMAQFEALANSEKKFSWAYIFYYCSIINGGYHIYPKNNLIDNIGFGDGSTHTEKRPDYYDCDISEMTFPIRMRKDIEWERDYDAQYFKLTQKSGSVVRIKQILGLDINKPIMEYLRG